MKKLSLLVALALLITFGAFAQVSLDYSVTGDAELIWGVELDHKNDVGNTHGFETKTNSTMDLTVTLDPAEVTKGGEGIYGEITLSGFGVAIGEGQGIKWKDALKEYDEDGDSYGATDEVAVASDLDDKVTKGQEKYDYTFIETGIAVSNPDVAAKIVLSDALFVQIASKPDYDANIETISDWGLTGQDFDVKGGVIVGYMSDMVDVNVLFSSEENHENNTYDQYQAGVNFEVKGIDIVTIKGKAYYLESMTNGYPSDMQSDALWYLEAGVSSTPIDMLTVNLDAAFEILPADGSDSEVFPTDGMEFEIDLDVPVTVADNITVTPRVSAKGQAGWYNEAKYFVTDSTYAAAITPYLTADWEDELMKTKAEPIVDAQLKAEITGDAALSATLTAKDVIAHKVSNPTGADAAEELFDVMTMDLEVAGSYKAALSDSTYVKPGFTTKYDWKNVDYDEGKSFNEDDDSTTPEVTLKAANDDVWELELYVEAGLIDNTVFTLKWDNNQLLDHADAAAVYKGDEAGTVTFSTKISY